MAKKARRLSVVPFKARPTQTEAEHVQRTCRDMLMEMVADIDAGKLAPSTMLIVFGVPVQNESGNFTPGYWQHGLGTTDVVAYAELVKVMALENWKIT